MSIICVVTRTSSCWYASFVICPVMGIIGIVGMCRLYRIKGTLIIVTGSKKMEHSK